MADSKVRMGACQHSLERFEYTADDPAEDVTTVPSGVAETQQRGGTSQKLP